MGKKEGVESKVREIARKTRGRYSAEEKIRIVLEGLKGEESIASLCRREGIAPNLYYSWSKEFLEAGKRRLKKEAGTKGGLPTQAQIARQAGLAWLRTRAEHNGLDFEDELVRVEGHRQIVFPRKGRRVNLSCLEFSRLLTVTDTSKFERARFAGIGSAKGFGFGLLLVKRP